MIISLNILNHIKCIVMYYRYMFIFNSCPTSGKHIALCTKDRQTSSKISVDIHTRLENQYEATKKFLKRLKDTQDDCLKEHNRLTKENLHYRRTTDGEKVHNKLSDRFLNAKEMENKIRYNAQ
jgi:hypothetical protein